jgi:polyisoprenoid-binding protein YceI
MIKSRFSIALLAALFAAPAFAAPMHYTIDPNHSQLHIQWTHFGLSNIQARFNKLEGSILYDAENPAASSVEASIAIDSIDSGVDDLDEHLRTNEFFDAAKFPTATFKSTKVTASGDKKLSVTGDLTVHGVTKPVTLDVTINQVGPHGMTKKPAAGFDATTTLKRSDFGVSMYVPNVSDDIKVTITIEATGKPAE